MSRNSGGDTTSQGGASNPTQSERDREFEGIKGFVAEKGGRASPGNRERGETGPAERDLAIDLETAHDRAS